MWAALYEVLIIRFGLRALLLQAVQRLWGVYGALPGENGRREGEEIELEEILVSEQEASRVVGARELGGANPT